MSRFKLYAKLAILAMVLMTTLHLAYPSAASIWHLSRVAAGYQHTATYNFDTPLQEEPAEPNSVKGEQQGSTYQHKERVVFEKESSGTYTTQESVAHQVQSPSGEQSSPQDPQEPEKPKDEFDDIPEETAEERHCFKSGIQSPDPIPKVLNFIWLNRRDLSFISYLSIRAALVSLQPDRLNLHHTGLNEDNEWLRKLRANLTLVHHDLNQEYPKQVEENWHLAHVSDVMRLEMIKRDGGIYFDMDIIALQPFDNLLHSPKDVVLGHEGRNRGGLCNGILLGRKGAAFLDRWTASYSTFDVREWNTHSVVLPVQWSLAFPEEVCTLSPQVFFWPSWGDGIEYMHRPLTDSQARGFEKTLASHNGSMYPHQLAYHAWHQVTPQLDNLTPEIIKTQNTRFNMLVRRFLE
ncbi:uncharacterized protein PFLUO_LOCUS6455 [Penicillium psychrofluorescens]|uniref:uncharacterized protein n=1 Tax=Penicillium psychrofluorescens TaxID=3158075 RepID=UPI003CCE265E